MGIFGTKKKEEVESVEQTFSNEKETNEREGVVTCNNCGKDYKEGELNDNGFCENCVEAKTDKIENFGYKVVISYNPSEDGSTFDDYEIDKISHKDAISCYEIIRGALMIGGDYVELPEMALLDDNDEEDISYPKTMFIGNKSVDSVYYKKMEEE